MVLIVKISAGCRNVKWDWTTDERGEDEKEARPSLQKLPRNIKQVVTHFVSIGVQLDWHAPDARAVTTGTS